jgi:uncharacterized membrane protein (UPF0182 family)
MRDMFDEFMEELRRRQAAAEGRSPDESAGERRNVTPDETSPGGGTDQGDTADARADDRDLGEAGGGGADEPDRDADGGRPTPLRRPARAGSGPGRGTGADPTRAGRPQAGGPGGRRPRTTVGGPDDGASRGRGRRIGLITALVIVFAVLFLGGGVVTFWTDAIWYRSVGFDSVFWTRVLTQLGLFVGTLVAALIVLLGNLWLAGRAVPAGPASGLGLGGYVERWANAARNAQERRVGGLDDDDDGFPFGRSPFGPRSGQRRPPGRPIVIEGDEIPDLTPIARIALVVIAIIAALGIAGSVASSWETIQLWAHQVPYSTSGPGAVTDPIFGRDIGFFLFQLPFLRLLQSIATSILIAALVVVVGRFGVAILDGSMGITTRLRVHIGILGGLLILLIAAGYQLDKLELVYSTRGVAEGVSYTDQNAQFFAFDVLTVIGALTGAFLLGAAFTRWVWPLGLAVGVWLVASFVLGTLYPEAVQRFSVTPNQFAQEQGYIANNIRMTRLAFGLDAWVPVPFKGDAPLTSQAIADESATFQNARVWDYRPLGSTLGQLQTIRQYYTFADVDTDRYQINGQLRQVMLSARELATNNPLATSWVNQRITFTHGIGLAMVPVNEATSSGQPQLFIRDLPPVSTNGAPPVSEPRIYFGEEASDYVIVNARQAAFDYPVGTEQGGEGQRPAPPWTGTQGIGLDTTLSRLLFAARFTDLNLLISDQITSDSKLLFHRSLQERVSLIAPFLRFDKDPYVVVTGDGRLEYIQDAYTISDRFPNAQAFDGSTLPGTTTGGPSGLESDQFNYIRNSVKIVMNAYDGSMTFYVSDPADPIIRAYQGVFPDLFKSMDTMPADVKAHLRVPEELFNVQTRQYATYHITDPATFYSKNDLWTVPAPSGSSQALQPEAYYVVMRLPDEQSPEFLLLQPMVPNQRPNMIAWIAARMDGPNYGATRVYQFPQDTTVQGPNQIEARIDGDPTISGQVSLWDQSGSKVIKGNLIVLPLQDALIYLQPVYLQSASAAFPQLQKVVVATSSTVAWGNTLQDSLRTLLAGGNSAVGGGPLPSPTPTPGGSPGPTPSGGPVATPPADVAALIAYANEHFEKAQAALRNGDFATYGQEIALVQQALEKLQALTGSPAPTAPSGSPAPGATAPGSSASPAP